MKSLLILAAVLSLSIGAKAGHYDKAAVVFKTNGDFPIIVDMDGHRGHESPKKVVQFNNVRPGRHFVRIYRIRKHGYWGSPRREIIYSGNIRVNPGLKAVYGIRRGQLRLLTQKPLQGGFGNGHGQGYGYGQGACSSHGTYNCGCDGYPKSNHPQWGPPMNNYGCYDGHCSGNCGGSCGYGSGHSGQYDHDGYYDDHSGWNGGQGQNGHGGFGSHWKAMPNGAFESILNRSKRHFNDEQKVSFFLRELDNYYINTAQARRMADELFFEQQKYHLLTSLYDQVIDQDRYSSLSSTFFFNNTKGEFEDYIHTNYRKQK